jgi:arabinan endo-1,5-alpha-L-arabinosidase
MSFGGIHMLRIVVAFALMLTPLSAFAQDLAPAPAMTGDVKIHDPAVIVENGHWVSFQTGDQGGLYRGAIKLKTSPDGINWTNAGAIGKGVPKWAEKENHYKSQNIWAPSAIKHGDRWYLYYSVSSFGLQFSSIGLMTNEIFDPTTPDQGWVDQGLVLKSTSRDDFNAIDPYRIDTSDGRAWLSFGSYWSGIKLRELNPETGQLLTPDTPVHDLAWYGGGVIEASAIIEHDGKFYLFVSYDRCCAGVDSTYRIMIGRADAITGPYVGKDGVELLKAGATELQKTSGRYIGPGGQEPVFGAPADMLVYHYYDGDDLGVSKLQIVTIHWTDDGWPELPPPPQ